MAETFVTVYQGAGGRIDLGYDYTQDITNNKTTLTVKAYVVKTNSSYYSSRQQPQTFTLTVNGTATTYGWTFDFTKMTLNARYLITSAVREITHNADGTKSNVTASVYCSTGTEGLGVVSGSTSIAIATIPRASTPTISATTTAIGSAVTINTNRASTSFTHTITYLFGSASGTIATGVGTSYAWTLPTSLANQIPNTVSGSGSIKLKTYSGTTLIGEKSIAFTVTVPNTSAFQPTASGLVASINGSGRDKTIGKFVQSISKVYMSFSSTANGGATITSNSINIKKGTTTNSMTVNGTAGTSGTVTSSGVYTITATTTDSRNRSKTTSITITVEAYAVPKITSFTATRQSTTKTSVDTVRNGTYAYMSGSNPLSVVVAIRPRGGSYTNLNTTAGTTSGTFSGTYVSIGNSETTSYDFKLTITDSFGNSAVSEITVPTSSVALSIAGDTGIGVGKIHEQGALDLAGNFYLNGEKQGSVIKSLTSGTDLNTVTETGSYRLSGTHSNAPSGYAYGQLLVIYGGSDTIAQLLFPYSSDVVWRRSGNPVNVGGAGSWRSWVQIGDGANASLLSGYGASSSNTANSIALRDSSGDLHTRLLRPTYANQTSISGAIAYRVNNSSDNYIRFCSDGTAIRNFIGAASSSHSHSYLPISEVATGKTGTITNASWSSISFGKTFSSVPKVVVTGTNSVTGDSFGKVRNVSTTGFEIVVGGTGTSNAFNWIAIK